MNRYPCSYCQAESCDYKVCEPYRKWLNTAWMKYQRHVRHNYWGTCNEEDDKLCYVHPDVIRRYLQFGPCDRCRGNEICRSPCKKYWHWWDARMAWLKWKLQNPGQ